LSITKANFRSCNRYLRSKIPIALQINFIATFYISTAVNAARSGANGATAVTAYRLGQSRFQGYGATGANYVVAIISGNWYASAEL
jgi:hypothetical protein